MRKPCPIACAFSLATAACTNGCVLDWDSKNVSADASMATGSEDTSDGATEGGEAISSEGGQDTSPDSQVEGDGSIPVPCDSDGDGFFSAHTTCDSVRLGASPDCDDAHASVYPGAPVQCDDGLRNSCAPWNTDATTFADVAEAGFLPESIVHTFAADYLSHWAFTAGRRDDGTVDVVIGILETPIGGTGTAGDVAKLLRFPLASPGQLTVARVTAPADLWWWQGAPVPVWTASGADFHRVAGQKNTGYALPMKWSWDGIATSVSPSFGSLPSECKKPSNLGSPVSAHVNGMVTLTSSTEPGTNDGLLIHSGVVARCAPYPRDELWTGLYLADRFAVIGVHSETSLLVWDLSTNGPSTYQLSRRRAGPTAPLESSLDAVSPNGGSIIIAYASEAGLTIESIDTSTGGFARTAAVDVPITGMSLRGVEASRLGSGVVLLTLTGSGATSSGKVPAIARMLLIRANYLEVVADISTTFADGPYATPSVRTVDPSPTEQWWDALLMREQGGLKLSRIRLCKNH